MSKYGSKKWLQSHIKELQNISDFMAMGGEDCIVEEKGKRLTFNELALRNLTAEIKWLREV